MLFLCAALVLLPLQDATCLLFYISPLSYILVYKQYNLYILLIVAYMLSVLLRRKNVAGFVSVFLLMAYCLIFANHALSMKIGYLIHPILLLVLVLVCQFTERKNYSLLLKCFLMGFVLSAILGLFREQLPMISDIFTSDVLYIDGVETSLDIKRYAGLSYDPNFFALLDCVLISMLLFNERKFGLVKGAALLFLIVIGFFTFSKSYVILLSVVFVMYIIKRGKRPIKTLVFVCGVWGCMLLLERFSGIQILSLIEARFTAVDGTNELTTGRIDLWKLYIKHIFSSVRGLLVGDGFNALSLGKAVHNTYIDFIYRFGFIGSALWIVYFSRCKKLVDGDKQRETSLNVTGWILAFGIFFLSAFHFQQLWCCIFFAFSSPYSNGEKYEKIECDCPDL